MAVQVINTAAGDWATEIETEVKRVRFQCRGEQALGEGELLEKVSAFGAGELVEIRHLAERDGEEVAGVVGKTVQYQIRHRATVNNERGAIIAEGRQLREGALHRGRISRRFDVFHAPVRVELLHVR